MTMLNGVSPADKDAIEFKKRKCDNGGSLLQSQVSAVHQAKRPLSNLPPFDLDGDMKQGNINY